MTSPGRSGGGFMDDPAKVLSLAVLALLFGGTIVSLAMGWLDGAIRWLVAQHVLVPAGQSPMLVIPGTHGAGLDLGRVMIVGSVVALLLVTACAGVVRARRRRQMMEQQQ